MTSSSNFKAEYLAYAFHCIAAKSDEDRFSASMNHAKSGMRNLASFGIFDGHMGVRFILLKGVLKLLHYHAFNFHPPKCSVNHLILFNFYQQGDLCRRMFNTTPRHHGHELQELTQHYKSKAKWYVHTFLFVEISNM